MKKRRPYPILHRGAAAVFCLIGVLLIAGCASRSGAAAGRLQPFSLMPENTVLYVQFPAVPNEGAVRAFTDALAPQLAPADIRKVLKRVDTVYAGFDASGNLSSAVTGSFPSFALGAVFSKKNGWRKIPAASGGGAGAYYARPDIPLQFAFPSSSLAFIAADVSAMFAGGTEPDIGAAIAIDGRAEAVSSSYGFTHAAADDIRFYIKDPIFVMRRLRQSGFVFDFPLAAVSGTLSFAGLDPETGSPAYALTALIELSDSRALRPALAMLGIAVRIGGKNFDFEAASADSVRISGAVFNIDTIVSLFTNQPS
ncbi:hypothetical protein [Treponema brennaborense]|uniref:Outer membrane-associated lipoprotein TP0453 domain-containing protein n=1 Tax=Treponema brennaborense (strain DSM 12168 / CIP 105900 / DD5/3) TaxID=906968 RepID=F4LP88_TREBD|nr:hypothetical protein [Treponema brennaborense]AEE16950.1 hypothetical protein Trebr_1527 [Treponema brennaborense DSM 12168]